MNWQFIAMWLVVGAAVIWIAARWFKRAELRRRYNSDNSSDKNKKPPCCN